MKTKGEIDMQNITAQTSMEAPNREYLELNFVGETATGRGNNQKFIMENLQDGTFRATNARVGITVGRHKPRSYILSMEEWNNTYRQKIQRGYLLTKKQKMEQKVIKKQGITVDGEDYRVIDDEKVREIVSRLINYTKTYLDTNYTVKVEDISDEMISFGREILNSLASDFSKMSVAEFNNKLKALYSAIPRRMDKLSNFLAKRKLDFNDIVANEQELFDTMVSQVRSGEKLNSYAVKPTILEAYNLLWRCVTPEEEKQIRKMLQKNASEYVQAWRIVNQTTEKRFCDFCFSENLTESQGISHLFHGSRSENFWSIISNGLTINPMNVVVTGKMFGNGTYFAPLAQKSLGYTSRRGSYWASGNMDTGFLGVYKVATGKKYEVSCKDSSLNWKVLQAKCPGAHCTWAKSGVELRNDEVIVYQDCQSTIEYLIEIKR